MSQGWLAFKSRRAMRIRITNVLQLQCGEHSPTYIRREHKRLLGRKCHDFGTKPRSF